MICPKCGETASCIDSRLVARYRRRRYKCLECGTRFSTREIMVEEHKALVLGTREPVVCAWVKLCPHFKEAES